MTNNTRYEVIPFTDEETGDLIIPLPLPLMEAMKLKPGTEVAVDIDSSGNLHMRKK